ncbi:hypothetical protein U0C82_00130 [Fulvimarina sp. 2208YS6-2-32]|uniref:Uncharacterized protein n=1 Tax=Fulvimarina uroteuthidis TaxID=3098149 RepID=A0ABU5HXQ3_9HYPH|nr:hypothetical protein [Fulvimarina sp. 2208YS6-2-32]MDY8107553.1 hypothetical protein [Fulvimarina sp. 2208YS6-2-32]
MRSVGLLAATAALTLASFPAATSAVANGLKDRDGYDIVGIRLSEREREESRPVRLPDGRVVLRPVDAGGIPFLYGFGDARGAPSGLPTTNGVTPTISASTPSGGLVPGQESR